MGGTPSENARITTDILSGKEKGGRLNAVLLNAGASFFIAKKASSIKEGIEIARYLIESLTASSSSAIRMFILISP